MSKASLILASSLAGSLMYAMCINGYGFDAILLLLAGVIIGTQRSHE